MSARSRTITKYGGEFPETILPVVLEMSMCREGGRFLYTRGGVSKMIGNGLAFHFKEAAKLLWPEIVWHEWNELFLQEWLTHKHIGVLGPTNSSKSCTAALCHLLDYYMYPTCTTVLICSTTRESLENRIWGEMKKLHRQVVEKYPQFPGHLIEGKQRIVTDDRSEAQEGRDFRNGILGVPMLKGGQLVGLQPLIGIKNKRLRLCGDELQMLPRAFIDSLSNLMKGPERRVTGMGNPSDALDALGLLCEPAASIGGWDSGIDQVPKTKTWETRWPGGICVQLCGADCPNMRAPVGVPPPYPFLITRQNMEDDAKVWGTDDWHYKMFNEAMLPRGQGSRRVITRQMCLKFHAMDAPVWMNNVRTKIAFLDAAYRGVGGDRCVFGVLEFGEEAVPLENVNVVNLLRQDDQAKNRPQILALVETMVIPIKAIAETNDSAEDQIVAFVQGQCQQRGIEPGNFFFDAGMRTSLVSAFARVWSPKVESIDFGGACSERAVSANIDVLCKDYYSKFVTELWWTVRMCIEAGQFRGMTEEMMLEGCAREWKTVKGNKIEVESKEEMKLKTARSPDLFDALVCGVHGAIQRGFVIKKLEAPERGPKRMDAWKKELIDRAKALHHGSALNYSV